MTPDIFRQSQNLFLVFSPGCGGNHLANMLSMHPVFAPRYSHENYYKDMEERYNNFFVKNADGKIPCTAHFCDLENLQLETLIKFTDKIVNYKEPYIFCTHAVEYAVRKKERLLDPFQNKIFCIFTKPNGSNKLVDNRMRSGLWYKGEPDNIVYLNYKVADLYNPEVFAKCTNIEKDKIFVIDTNKFYTEDGFDYLNEVVVTNLGFELPEVCRKLHKTYIEYVSILFGNS